MRLWTITITSEPDPHADDNVIVKLFGLDFVPDEYLDTLQRGITEELANRAADSNQKDETECH